MKHTLSKDISSLTLHLFAMAAMLCNHPWATLVPGNDWLTWVGRLAFPIFALASIPPTCWCWGCSANKNGHRAYRRPFFILFSP